MTHQCPFSVQVTTIDGKPAGICSFIYDHMCPLLNEAKGDEDVECFDLPLKQYQRMRRIAGV
jgi:hypothetical protein